MSVQLILRICLSKMVSLVSSCYDSDRMSGSDSDHMSGSDSDHMSSSDSDHMSGSEDLEFERVKCKIGYKYHKNLFTIFHLYL